MARTTVLVIDPDKEHVESVRRHLTGDGYDVIAAFRGDAGLDIALRHTPDLVLLEVRIAGMDGLEICRRLRSTDGTSRIPVIILSELRAELDRVLGLELGADDYVTKPFSPRELMARIKAVLRRVSAPMDSRDLLRAGGLVLDKSRREVTYRGDPIALSATEFRILECLMRRPGRVLSRCDILGIVHADDVAVADRTIDVHVGIIRRKLGGGGELIETLRGFGYRFRDESRRRTSPGADLFSSRSPFGGEKSLHEKRATLTGALPQNEI